MLKKYKLKFIFGLLFSIFLTLGLSISLQSLLAQWTPPSDGPTEANVPAPLNVGEIDQIKAGGIILGGVDGLSLDKNKISSPSGQLLVQVDSDFKINNTSDEILFNISSDGNVEFPKGYIRTPNAPLFSEDVANKEYVQTYVQSFVSAGSVESTSGESGGGSYTYIAATDDKLSCNLPYSEVMRGYWVCKGSCVCSKDSPTDSTLSFTLNPEAEWAAPPEWAKCIVCGTAKPSDAPFGSSKIIFATYQLFIGGVTPTGADTACQNHADEAGLLGDFGAFMFAAGELKNKFSSSLYVNTRGQTVLKGFYNHLGQFYLWLENPIKYDAFGREIDGYAWIQTVDEGQGSCGYWQSTVSTQFGRYFDVETTNAPFLNPAGQDSCTVKHRLICLEK